MQLQPDFESFSRAWRAGKNQVVWTTLVSDLETPVSAMLKLGKGQPYCFLLESIEGGAVRGRYSIIGREPDLIWRCDNGRASCNRQAQSTPDHFVASSRPALDDLRALMNECRIDDPQQPQPMAAGLFGYLGYEMIGLVEKLPEPKSSTLDVPDALLIRPTLLAIFDQIDNLFTLVTPAWFTPEQTAEATYAAALERLKVALHDLNTTLPVTPAAKLADTPVEAQPVMSEAAYLAAVNQAKDYIRAGDIFQVVLSQRFTMPFDQPAFNLYRMVRRLDPSPFLFFFDLKDLAIVGCSPEILVRVRDGKITVRPIAGTRPRDVSNHSDAELAADLLADPKELAEHLMLLDLGRNDVGRVARTGSVKVTAQNTIEYYKHVMHIVSNVEGELADDRTPLDALIGGFPAGTVSGAPKIRAMEIIHELEPHKRGVYAGCIGYFGANDNMDTCIAIRTAVIKDGVLTMQAGAGIVFDSEPQSEHRECAAKARTMLRAAQAVMQGKLS
jgi:anthranilate synthase component 1